MKPAKPIRHKTFAAHWIPIYGNVFTFGVVDGISKFLRRSATIEVFGDLSTDGDDDTSAVTLNRGIQFAVILDRKMGLKHNEIAHEIMHATHRILERHSIFLTPKHHEAHCYLCGYLTELVYGDLKKWRISIR